MEFDPLRQWQALAGLWSPAAASPAGLGSFAAAAEQFNAAAAAFLSAQAQAPAAAAATASAADSFQRFLREQFGALMMPWSIPGRPDSGPGPAGRGPEGLALGAGREQQQRLQRLTEAAAAIDAAQRRLQLLWADALREAASAYGAQLAAAGPADASPQVVRVLYDRWIDCAEQAYARMAHGQAYATALADYVNAGSRWRAQMQACLEQWARLLDLPTRAELNTLIERLNALETAARHAPRPRRSRKS